MIFGAVYLVRNTLNGKSYVGITTQRLKSRWRQHIREAMNGRCRWALHRAIKAYGADVFEVSLLQECPSRETLENAERRLIAVHNTFSPQGYNLTIGGGGASGFKHFEDRRRELSEKFRGRTYSSETIERMRRSAQGRKASPETRAKIAALQLGRKRSVQTCARISAAGRGRKLSQEQVEGMRQRKLGTTLSAEAKAAISRPVIAEGVRYDSVSAAASALQVSMATISRRIDAGATGYKSLAERRTRAKRSEKQVGDMKQRLSVGVLAGGAWFASITDAASALELSRQGVAYRIRSGVEGYARL